MTAAMHKRYSAAKGCPGQTTGLSEGGQGWALLTLEKAPATFPLRTSIFQWAQLPRGDQVGGVARTALQPEPVQLGWRPLHKRQIPKIPHPKN